MIDVEDYLLSVARGRRGVVPALLRTGLAALAPVYCAGAGSVSASLQSRNSQADATARSGNLRGQSDDGRNRQNADDADALPPC